MIPLGPGPARPLLTGVFFEEKRAGYWKAILAFEGRVQYIRLPGTSEATTRGEATELARQIEWHTA